MEKLDTVDCVVIGAGVVGLAVARALVLLGFSVVVLEKNCSIGMEISSRNSEVIHAGLYYGTDFLKTQLCIRGRQLLYQYCAKKNIPHKQVGKLLVATTEAEQLQLMTLYRQALDNGVQDLQILTAQQAKKKEPLLHCVESVFSPSTGIIDVHAFMKSLKNDLTCAGGDVVCDTKVLRVVVGDKETDVHCLDKQQNNFVLPARWVINCGGLHAQTIAASVEGFLPQWIPKLHLSKGHYFSLQGPSPFSCLVYPTPNKKSGTLGVHSVIDLAGVTRFGPDQQDLPQTPLDSLDYDVPAARANVFYSAIRSYFPALPDHSLYPAYSGIRPKIHAPLQTVADFCIQGPDQHGMRGLIHLFGIESPGMTSALAIADLVKQSLL